MNILNNSLIEKLKNLPETGMGYQKVNAILINGEKKPITILNSSIVKENIDIEKIIDIEML